VHIKSEYYELHSNNNSYNDCGLSHEVVVSFMRWLFREATTSFSLLALSPPYREKSYVTLHGTTYRNADVYQCIYLLSNDAYRYSVLKHLTVCFN
jgi:hypothetical protein